jgi:hypothetical protein
MLIADSDLAQAGRQYLDPAAATAWVGLLRPGFRLRSADTGEQIIGYLGGNPLLPDDAAWPEWEEQGPLTFVGAVDCGALPTTDLGIPLPNDGALLFFYFDGQAGDGTTTVDYWEPGSARGGSRVLYVPADVEMAERLPPDPITAYAMVPLTGELVATYPDIEHPAFRAVFGDPYAPDAPQTGVTGDQFNAALDAVRRARAPHHHIGGYAVPLQGSAETEAAYGRYPGNEPEAAKSRAELAAQLVLLAQVGSERSAGMSWGDTGSLYYFIHPDDLAAGRFDACLFTWQSH